MYNMTCVAPTKFYNYEINGEIKRLPSPRHMRLFKRKFVSLEEIVKYAVESEYVCLPRISLELCPKDYNSFIQKYHSYRNKKS